MQRYPYRALDPTKQQIRLLLLEGISSDGELSCHIEHTSLDDGPSKRYSAISYRWGHASDKVNIRLDGQKYLVPRSAAVALRGTHQTTRTTSQYTDDERACWYWIDVICIDQDNLEEKASQVALMGEIYARAARTLIWLGEEPSCCGSELAFSLVEEMFEHIRSVTEDLAALSGHLWSEREEDERKYRASALEMPVGSDWHAINCLFAQEWFRRLWCIQEVALSHQTICCCGSSSMDFDKVSLIARWLVSVRDWKQKAFARGVDGNGQKGIDNAACMWDQWKGKLPPKLDMLLYTSYWCETSDPLDKVYGFLGIWRARAIAEAAETPEHLAFLRPDYRSPMAEVYAGAFRAVILVSKNLAVLDVVDAGRVDAETIEGPSWVPRLDLGFSGRYSPEVFSTESVGASGGRTVVLADGTSWDTLQVRGLILDNVAEIRAIPQADSWTISTCKELLQWMSQKICKAYGADAGRVAAEVLTVRNDTAAVDEYPEIIDEVSAAYEGSETQHDDVKQQQHTESSVQRFHNASAFWTRARAVIRTEQGQLGLVKTRVLPGDAVCILFGSRKPVVLRPCNNGWLFVGVAFVHGLMDGEYKDLLKSGGDASEQEQWFSIR